MSSNTKQVLAITLGSLGLVLGVLGTVVAYNAKEATDNDTAVTSQVQSEFARAQAEQDAKEESQVSNAEKFVEKLSIKDKSLLKSIDTNAASIKKNKKTINSLKSEVKTLDDRDQETASQISSIEADQTKDYNKLNKRINQTNANVNKLTRQVQNLRTKVNVLEANP